MWVREKMKTRINEQSRIHWVVIVIVIVKKPSHIFKINKGDKDRLYLVSQITEISSRLDTV